MIGIIPTINRDRIIGVNGKIPWHYSNDLKRFKKLTLGTTVIMGRKTWESIGKELSDRRNIVITSKRLESVEHYSTVLAALDVLMKEDTLTKIWFIGGHNIYKEGLKHASTIDMTHVLDQVKTSEADEVIYFPEFNSEKWSLHSRSTLGKERVLVHEVFRRTA